MGSTEIAIDLHNPYESPEFFQVDIDRGTLPSGARIDVRLTGRGASPPGDSRVLIPARSRVRARIAVDLPTTIKPGRTFRFAAIQRRKGNILGGRPQHL